MLRSEATNVMETDEAWHFAILLQARRKAIAVTKLDTQYCSVKGLSSRWSGGKGEWLKLGCATSVGLPNVGWNCSNQRSQNI